MKHEEINGNRAHEGVLTELVSEGQSGMKGYTWECAVLRAMTVSAVLCVSQQL